MSASVSAQVTTWEVAHGYRADHPAGDALAAALPQAPSITHMRATPYAEVGACWEDIAPDATGMKRKRTHRLPLSDHAVAVLREAWPRQDGWVFCSQATGHPFAETCAAVLFR